MPRLRKVLIIYPPMVLPDSQRPSYTFPIGAGYIAAALEQAGFQTCCLDALAGAKGSSRAVGRGMREYGMGTAELMERIEAFEPDVVGFSCQFSVQYSPTRALLAELRRKRPRVLTMIGGSHSSAQPEQVLVESGVDYVVLSEGERTVLQLLGALERGEPVDALEGLAWLDGGTARVNPRSRFIETLDDLPFPARHLFDMEAYFDTPRGWGSGEGARRLSLITSRGCPFRCTFCGIHLNTGKKFRMRSAANVLAEIDRMVTGYGITELMFEDDNISLDRQRFLEILRGLIARNYGISWTATSGMALWTLDDEVLQLMRESGCRSVYLGIESGNERVLREVIRKQLTDKDEIRRRVAMVQRHGLATVGFWVIGNPGETRKEMWDTLDFARELSLDYNQVLVALPYRGTELHDICVERGYLTAALDPDQMLETKAMIRTPEFSPQDVLAIQEAGRFLAVRRKGRSLPQALSELFGRHGFFAFRVLIEIARKQGGYYQAS